MPVKTRKIIAMKSTIKKLSFAIAFLTTIDSYGQPGELTHPAHKNKSKIVNYSIYSIPEGVKPIIIYDGVTLFNVSSLKTLDPGTINSMKRSQDSILDHQNNLRFNAILEIVTVEGANATLKYVKDETKYWIKEHPLAVFYLNGKVLLEDHKLDQLMALKIADIKEIKTLNSDLGRKLLGATGEMG